MLRPSSHSDGASGNAEQKGPGLHQPDQPGYRERLSGAEHTTDYTILNDDLQSLCYASRKFAAALNLLQQFRRHFPGAGDDLWGPCSSRPLMEESIDTPRGFIAYSIDLHQIHQ